MRILIVTPLQPEATGNGVTSLRYRKEMEARGYRVRLVMTDEEDPAPLQEALDQFRPDLVHLLHAYRSGRPWLECAPHSAIPFVVTLTGTDIHQGMDSPAQGSVIRQVLERADAVITQNRLTFAELKGRTASWIEHLRYLPPSIVLGTDPFPLRQLHGIPSNHVLFLHPAGIRQVKGNLEMLRLFDAVATERSDLTVVFCGPILEEEYGRQFLSELAERPWSRYLGTVPPAAMAAALKESDVVLNNSSCEGLSNVLVEASVLGRPLLVRNISGNAALASLAGLAPSAATGAGRLQHLLVSFNPVLVDMAGLATSCRPAGRTSSTTSRSRPIRHWPVSTAWSASAAPAAV